MAAAAVGTSGGSTCAQISCAFQQRVRKRQPEGGLAGLGTSPSSTMRLRLPRCAGARSGPPRGAPGCTGARRARRSSSRVPDLDDLAEVHHRDAVGDVPDDREVVRDEEIRQRRTRAAALASRLITCAWIETSSAETGSSSTTQLRVERERAGDADALPLAAGELVREAVARAPGSGRPTRSSSSTRGLPSRPRDSCRGCAAARRRCRAPSCAG